MSNAPGTTQFLPVVDNTRQYINVLLILLSEPTRQGAAVHRRLAARSGRRTRWSGRRGRRPSSGSWTRSRTSRSAASSGRAAASPRPTCPAPLGSITTVRTDYEAHFLFQNLMLTAEALRLGAWVHGAPMIPHVWQRDPAEGHPRPRLPRVQRARRSTRAGSAGRRCPPPSPPTSGIDGVLEGLCPPYVNDMDAAVDQVLEEKFGPDGHVHERRRLRAVLQGQGDRGGAT